MAGGSLYNSTDEDNFDDEFDTQPEAEAAEEESDEIDEVAAEATAEDEQLDEEMSEAERRIQLAGYYKQLARGGVFNDGSEEAAIVDQELKDFARERMSILLNLTSAKPKVELPFTEEQIQVLGAFADKVIQKRGEPDAPMVKPLAPPAPVQQVAPKRPAGPVVKALAAPPGARPPQQPKAPGAAPVKRPVAPKKPAPAAVAKPAPKGKTKKRGSRDYTEIPDGEVFEEKGKHYKFVINPDTAERVKINVTKQVMNPHRIPMPVGRAAIEAANEMAAHASLNNNPALKDQRLLAAAALSHVNNSGE